MQLKMKMKVVRMKNEDRTKRTLWYDMVSFDGIKVP